VAAAVEAVAIIEENAEALRLPSVELRCLGQLKHFLSTAPDEAGLIEECLKRFVQKVPEFKPSNYAL
jgi:hypothetical protein